MRTIAINQTQLLAAVAFWAEHTQRGKVPIGGVRIGQTIDRPLQPSEAYAEIDLDHSITPPRGPQDGENCLKCDWGFAEPELAEAVLGRQLCTSCEHPRHMDESERYEVIAYYDQRLHVIEREQSS